MAVRAATGAVANLAAAGKLMLLRGSRWVVVTAVVVASASPSVHAQAPTGRERLTNVATNAAIGAAIGGLRAAIARKPVPTGVVRGAAGGSVTSVAKQVAADGFNGSGLLGRLISACGIAAMRWSSEDTLSFLLPFGPLVTEYRPRAVDRVQTRVNVWAIAVLVGTLFDSKAQFDPGGTLSTGAIVVKRPANRMPFDGNQVAFAHPGVIMLNRDALLVQINRRTILAHESVHILQWDAYHAVVTRPIERAALRRLKGGAFLNRRFELHALAPLSVWAIASGIPETRDRPWEREAYRLSGEPLPERSAPSLLLSH